MTQQCFSTRLEVLVIRPFVRLWSPKPANVEEGELAVVT